jgi:hypothetical protein
MEKSALFSQGMGFGVRIVKNRNNYKYFPLVEYRSL